MASGHPGAARWHWRRPLDRWLVSRLRRSDTHTLTQRNIYILPTRAGCMFALTLVTLLLASINYQLNLGFVLTFLLAGSGVVSMHITHNTLRGLRLHLRPGTPVHLGDAAGLEVVLTAPPADRRARHGIGLGSLSDDPRTEATLSWVDVPAGGQVSAHLSFLPAHRGWHELPTLTAETRFPLGLFRAWTVWRPASQALVYPRVESPAPGLPPAQGAGPSSPQASRSQGGEDTEGVRNYQRGDSPKRIVWKKAAKQLASGGELLSRDTRSTAQHRLWLDWQQCAGLPPEQRLERLCAWVRLAERGSTPYGLKLPAQAIEPALGDAHRRACLEALALC